jgi:methyl-accepting chemotaxis protein
MLRIADLRYRNKLLLMVGAAVIGILSVALLSYVTLSQVKIGSDLYRRIRANEDLGSALAPPDLTLSPVHEAVLSIESSRDAANTQRELDKVKTLRQNFEKSHDYFKSALQSAATKQMLDGNLYTAGEEYFDLLNNEYAPLVRAGKYEQAKDLRENKMVPIRQRQDAGVAELLQAVQQRIREHESEVNSEISRAILLTGLVTLAAFGFVSLVGFLVYRHVEKQVARFQSASLALARGDMTHRIEDDSADDLGEVARSLNESFTKVGAAIAEVRGHCETVASASDELSSSAAQVSTSSESQREQVTQVVTAMLEMSSTVMQVSDNSNRAAENAQAAGNIAADGGRVVEETIAVIRELADSTRMTAQKIEELGQSSNSIGKIIGTIDDIADQTNLLALNAAIEAARAGEQGRGFAVVADEVRKLAERTTTATKEVAAMIETIQRETRVAVNAMRAETDRVDAGLGAASKAGEVLCSIINSAGTQHEMITHIATAATQQAAATEQINGNMEQISRMVQQSAISAGESAKACQDLSSLAMDLQQVVAKFKVNSGDAGHRHAEQNLPLRDAQMSYPRVN